MLDMDIKKGIALCAGVAYEYIRVVLYKSKNEYFLAVMIKNKDGKFLGDNGDLFEESDVDGFIEHLTPYILNGELPKMTEAYPFVFDSEAWAEMVGCYFEGGFKPDKSKLDDIIKKISIKYMVKRGDQ